MNSHKQVLTFRKSVLSILLASVVTSGLIAIEKSHRAETHQLESNIAKALLPVTTLNHISKEITLIAQANRIEKPTTQSQVIGQDTTLKQIDVGELVNKNQISERLFFGFDSYRIQPVYYDTLARLAEQMKNTEDAEQKVWQVIGYADPSGDFLYNLTLSEKRAQSVADYLISEGVPADQLSVVSMGASQSDDEINDQALVARRVEIQPYQQEITTLASQLAKHKRDIQIARYHHQHSKILIDDVIAEKKKQQYSPQVKLNQSFMPLAIAMEF